jgi:ribosomal protein S18 acetylase RimI-like enzyme
MYRRHTIVLTETHQNMIAASSTPSAAQAASIAVHSPLLTEEIYNNVHAKTTAHSSSNVFAHARTQLVAVVELEVRVPDGTLPGNFPLPDFMKGQGADVPREPYLCNLAVAPAYRGQVKAAIRTLALLFGISHNHAQMLARQCVAWCLNQPLMQSVFTAHLSAHARMHLLQGIGKQLVRLSEHVVRNCWGAECLYLHVDPSNEIALALYTQMNYVKTAPQEAVPQWVAELLMVPNVDYFSKHLVKTGPGGIEAAAGAAAGEIRSGTSSDAQSLPA